MANSDKAIKLRLDRCKNCVKNLLGCIVLAKKRATRRVNMFHAKGCLCMWLTVLPLLPVVLLSRSLVALSLRADPTVSF